MLSGEIPPHHGVRDNTGFRFDAVARPCLPQLLATHGYATGGFVSAWVLRAATGLGACFQTYDDDLGGADGSAEQRPGMATLARAESWLESHRAGPFFLFLHLYEPHAPYTPPSPFDRELKDPYDGEIAAADAVVGKLVADLKHLGLYDEALIALVSDHGEGLGDHGELRHGVLLYDETVRVPWILKLPGNAWRGRRVDGPVSLVDLAPTLLAAVSVAAAPGLDGSSILASRPNADRTPVYIETWYPRLRLGWSQLAALVDRRYSTISGPAAEVYDLEQDPRQLHDLADQMRPLVAQRIRELREIDTPPAEPESADPETVAKMAALGYLAGGSARNTDSNATLPNPRERVRALSRMEEAIQADTEGDAPRSERELRAVLAENPDMVEALPFLARAELHQGRVDAALATLRTAQARDPHPSVRFELCRVLIQKGEFAEAERLAEGALGDDPRRAYQMLVEIAQLRGDRAAEARWSAAALDAGAAGLPILREHARELAAGGHPEQAVALLEPHAAGADAETLALLGMAMADSGRAEDALALLRNASRSFPGQPALLESLGVAALNSDHPQEALAALEQAVRAAPESASAWSTLGVARFRAGSPPGAVEAWKRAVELDPTRTDALYNLGFFAARLGQLTVARDALRRYLAVAGDAPDEDRARARQLLVQLGG